MGMQAVQVSFKKSTSVGPIAPYYGMSTATTITESLVLGLGNRGPTPGAIATTFTLNAVVGQGLYQYFAYPASYGLAQFLDMDSNFTGGWDGANNDPQNVYGPLELPVHISGTSVPFYVYRTDYPDLALCHWQASKSA
jgi:hypothetical protein